MSEVVAVVTDLFFQVRVSAAARAANRPLRFVTSLEGLAAAPAACLILVDLDADLDVPGAIRRLKGEDRYIVAFGPHLDTSSRKAARAAGANRVLAKSKFVADLPAIIRSEPSDLSARPESA